jgi:hypothetical protein
MASVNPGVHRIISSRSQHSKEALKAAEVARVIGGQLREDKRIPCQVCKFDLVLPEIPDLLQKPYPECLHGETDAGEPFCVGKCLIASLPKEVPMMKPLLPG